MDAPPIQYARTDDGVDIGYWTLGEGPPLFHHLERVKQPLAGEDFSFADQGALDLKGFDEPVRAWRVEWEESR